jgi:hypothetical protein
VLECLPLLTLSGATDNDFLSGLNSNSRNEIQGLPGQEAGWIRFDGTIATSSFTVIEDPAIYVVLIEKNASYAAADLPFEYCSQANGSLLPMGPLGDDE